MYAIDYDSTIYVYHFFILLKIVLVYVEHVYQRPASAEE